MVTKKDNGEDKRDAAVYISEAFKALRDRESIETKNAMIRDEYTSIVI